MKILITFISFFVFSTLLSAQTKMLTITPLRGDFYVFTTYKNIDGALFPANGLYLVTNNGVVLIDSPWNAAEFQPLLDSIEAKHHKHVILCIATHSHEDRTGALDYYKQKEIKTFTTQQTDDISKLGDEKRAEFLIQQDTTFIVGQYSFQTYYAGPGHTPDNIIIWFEKDKIIYGGCLVKSTEAVDLGYLGDANTKEWPRTIKNIQKKYKRPNVIIPGHQDWKSRQSLHHTLFLLRQYRKKKKE